VKPSRPDLAALALCGLVVVGIVALAALHVGIPDVLPYLAVAALSAGAGVAVSGGVAQVLFNSAGSSTAPAPSPARVPAPAPAPAVETVEPVATHAP
jgi:hypothetical protein